MRLGYCLDDCIALSIEIIDQGSEALPVHKRLRPCNRREPFAHLFRKFARALRLGQFQPQASFAGALPLLISISNSARRPRPTASRLFALRVVLAATPFPP